MVDSSLWIFLLVQQMVDSTRSVFVQICLSFSFFSLFFYFPLSLFLSFFLATYTPQSQQHRQLRNRILLLWLVFRLQIISEDLSL